MLRRSAIRVLVLSVAAILPTSARTRPHYGGTLRVETVGDAWQGTNAVARGLVFNGLTELDAKGVVQPSLALGWQSDDSGHRWQLRLRSGVHFHDGSLLTSMNVVQSLNLSCVASCPWTAVRAIGSTLVFTSDTPLPNLPDLLASGMFLISLTRAADGQMPAQPIGTGPFVVASSANNVITLTANESSWQGRPFADRVIITSHRPFRDQWLDLSLGRADIVEVPAEQLRQAQQQHLAIVISQPVLALVLQVSDSGPLANPMLRSAIAYAVDRSAVYNVIFQKQGEVTASLLPKSITGYSFLFPVERDLNKATQVRGGLSVGSLTLSTENDGTMQLTAQRLALNLREAGFNVQILASGNSRRADLVLHDLRIEGSDAAGALGRLLLSAGMPPAVAGHDPQTFFRIERDLLNQHTIVPLLDRPRAFAVSGRVRNFRLCADGSADLATTSVEDAP